MKLKKEGRILKQSITKGEKQLITRTYKPTTKVKADFKAFVESVKRKLKKLMKRKKLAIGDDIQIIAQIEDDEEHKFYISGKLHKLETFDKLELPNLVVNKQYGSFENIQINNFYVGEVIFNIFH